MAAVAKRFILRMFASAPGNGLGSRDIRFDGREVGARVGAVAEWLARGPTASAPPISAGFRQLHDRTLLEYVWLAHAVVSTPAGRRRQIKTRTRRN